MKKWIACGLVFCLLMHTPGALTMRALAQESVTDEVISEDEIPSGENENVPETDSPSAEDDAPPAQDPPAEEDVPPADEDNDPPAQDPPAEEDVPPADEDDDPPAQDPPAEEDVPPAAEDDDPPAQDPPAEEDVPPADEDDDPPAQDPPADDKNADLPIEEDDPLSADAYILLDETRKYGDIEDLIPYGLEGYTIYLFHMQLIEIETDRIDGYDFELLENIVFDLCPDEGTGFDSRTVVHVSQTGSYGQDEYGKDYLWAGRPKEPEAPADEPEEPALQEKEETVVITEWELQVHKENYHADQPCEPVFTLIPSPDAREGMTLAVSINGGTPELLESAAYHPSYSGTYRFALLDADGTVLAWSAAIPVEVAWYQPEWSTEVEEEEAPALQEEDDDFFFEMTVEEDETDEDPPAEDPPSDAAPSDDTPAPDAPVEETPAEEPPVEEPLIDDMPVDDIPAPDAPADQSSSGDAAASDRAADHNLAAMPALMDEWDSMGVMNAGLELPDALDDGMMVMPSDGTDGEAPDVPPEAPAPSSHGYAIASDGSRTYGTLETLLESGANPIYITTPSLLVLSNSYAPLLSRVTLIADHTTYHHVYVSTVSPETHVESASSIFIRLDVKKNAMQEAFPVLQVSAGPSATAWSHSGVSFTLSVSEYEGLNNTYSYGVSVDGGSVLLLSQAYVASGEPSTVTYTASQAGKHSYEFLLVRHDGTEGERITRYANLDVTPPYLTVTSTTDYAMKIIIGDIQSGFGSLSINGTAVEGKDLTNEGGGVWTYTYSAPKQTTFLPGDIIVTDAAGNASFNEAAFTLYPDPSKPSGDKTNMGAGISFGKSSGGRGSGRAVYHSESDEDTVTAYNAVELVVSDEGMSRLEIGDEVLDLELSRKSPHTQGDVASTFTASFASWNGGTSKDTLVLTAAPDDISSDYTWSFSGAVYKKLAASGIDYIMLCVDDEITALSTAGFTAGIRYNMYRAEGLPSKDFRYDVRMGTEGLPFEMNVTVNGTTYVMSADTNAEMYYYDVYTGTAAQFAALER